MCRQRRFAENRTDRPRYSSRRNTLCFSSSSLLLLPDVRYRTRGDRPPSRMLRRTWRCMSRPGDRVRTRAASIAMNGVNENSPLRRAVSTGMLVAAAASRSCARGSSSAIRWCRKASSAASGSARYGTCSGVVTPALHVSALRASRLPQCRADRLRFDRSVVVRRTSMPPPEGQPSSAKAAMISARRSPSRSATRTA